MGGRRRRMYFAAGTPVTYEFMEEWDDMGVNRRDFLATAAVSLAGGLASAPGAGTAQTSRPLRKGATMTGVIFNQDCTQTYYQTPPEEMRPEVFDKLVDGLAAAGITAFLVNTQSQRTNYASKVWETFWDGFDPDGPDDQPFLAPVQPERRAPYRRMLTNMLSLYQQGCDPIERQIARCRRNGIAPWVSLRMNDLHDCDIPESPMLSSFFKSHPEWRRVPYRTTSWMDRALDYGRAEVRAHYMKLIRETAARWDIDGIELDFMRFPYHFRVGHEREGGELLTAWLERVRGHLDRWEQRRGHAIQLGVRVPSHPDTARDLGLDAVEWAHRGIVDLVVATPFWATAEFDMPVDLWRDLLDDSEVTLAAGLEVRVQPYPGGPVVMSSPQMARAIAASAFDRGADAVYLFNYFEGHWPEPTYTQTLRELASPQTLRGKDRLHLITYRDTLAPGEPQANQLPRKVNAGGWGTFRVDTGPRPESGTVVATLTLGGNAQPDEPSLKVRVNGDLCEDVTPKSPTRLAINVPLLMMQRGTTVIEVNNTGDTDIEIVGVEVAISGG